MMQYIALTVVILAFTHCLAIGNDDASQCQEISTRVESISVVSERNQAGQWVSHFTTSIEEPSIEPADNVTLNVTQKVTECNGQRIVHITVPLRGGPPDSTAITNKNKSEELLFHSLCGLNAEVTNGGRTLNKISLSNPINSVGFSNRPLKDNELFEVELEEKDSRMGYLLGIGVTIHSPADISFPSHMNDVPHPSWVRYHTHLYHNGRIAKQGQARDLNTLQVHNRVGVMRTNKGKLHFYINGVDQGPAASNVPSQIYGMFELWHIGLKASVVDSS